LFDTLAGEADTSGQDTRERVRGIRALPAHIDQDGASCEKVANAALTQLVIDEIYLPIAAVIEVVNFCNSLILSAYPDPSKNILKSSRYGLPEASLRIIAFNLSKITTTWRLGRWPVGTAVSGNQRSRSAMPVVVVGCSVRAAPPERFWRSG